MTRARILLAEDHKEMREQVVRLLRRDYEILGAFEDGRAVVVAAAQLKPDLFVLDISMPILNGIETAHMLVDQGTNAKIIFLTIYDDADFLQAALNAGASGYVLKRCLATDLLEAASQVLTGKTFISEAMREKVRGTERLSA
jgi:DNA-binding NarL/FixJ family response regulator